MVREHRAEERDTPFMTETSRERAHTAPEPARRAWRMRRGWSTLAALIGLAGGIWLFVALADEVADGDDSRIDNAVLLMFRSPADPTQPLGSPWLEQSLRDVTALGSFTVLGFVVLAAVGFLALHRRSWLAAFVFAASAGGIAVSTGLKALFERPRPSFGTHDVMLYTSSFPSQHSMMSAVVYLTIGALLARVQPTVALRGFVLAISGFLVLAIGLSRLYLGVHWPSDVLGGWLAGGIWALGCWLIVRKLPTRGDMAVGDDVAAKKRESGEQG